MTSDLETSDETSASEPGEDAVTSRVVVDFPPEEVWELLVDDGELSTWLGDDVTLEPVPGGHGHLTDGQGVEREIRVDDVRPGRSLAWRWWPTGDDDRATAVEIRLVPDGDGTEVRVTETVCSLSIVGAPGAVRSAWSDRLLSAELSMLSRQLVLVRV